MLVESSGNEQTIVDPKDAAQSVGLRYVSDARPGIRRRKSGKGFLYTRVDGSRLSEPDVLRRIKALAVPPAWTDVWICPFAEGHIQATGRDAKGRKQYRYHARFREVRESTKYERVIGFADALPSIREKVEEHMALRGLPREKVLATVVHLLETTLIRVGNDDYAKENNSYGLTTLKNRHVAVEGNEVHFRFSNRPFGSSTFRLSAVAVSMSLAGSCFSSKSAPRPFHHGIRRRGGTIFTAALPSDEQQVQAEVRTHLIHRPARASFHRSVEFECFSYRIWSRTGPHAVATFRVQRNSVPSTQMRCIITANRRASATIAFFTRGVWRSASPRP